MSEGKSSKDLLKGYGKSWAAEAKGEFIRFEIQSVETKPQVDDDGEPVYFKNSKEPMWAIIAQVTDLDDPETARSLWFTGGKFTALKNALKDLPDEQQDLEPGDSGVLTMTGQHKSTEAKKTGAKIYEVTKFKKGSKTRGALKSATAKAAEPDAAPTRPEPSTASSTGAYGDRPEAIPASVWSRMTNDEKAEVSPPPVNAPYGERPDAIPASVWSRMTDDEKAEVSPPATSGAPQRPEHIPEVAWKYMSDDEKAAAAKF